MSDKDILEENHEALWRELAKVVVEITQLTERAEKAEGIANKQIERAEDLQDDLDRTRDRAERSDEIIAKKFADWTASAGESRLIRVAIDRVMAGESAESIADDYGLDEDTFRAATKLRDKQKESMPWAYLKCERCGGRVRTVCEVCPECARPDEIRQCQGCKELKAKVKELEGVAEHLEDDCSDTEKELADMRHERDEYVDDRDEWEQRARVAEAKLKEWQNTVIQSHRNTLETAARLKETESEVKSKTEACEYYRDGANEISAERDTLKQENERLCVALESARDKLVGHVAPYVIELRHIIWTALAESTKAPQPTPKKEECKECGGKGEVQTSVPGYFGDRAVPCKNPDCRDGKVLVQQRYTDGEYSREVVEEECGECGDEGNLCMKCCEELDPKCTKDGE